MAESSICQCGSDIHEVGALCSLAAELHSSTYKPTTHQHMQQCCVNKSECKVGECKCSNATQLEGELVRNSENNAIKTVCEL